MYIEASKRLKKDLSISLVASNILDTKIPEIGFYEIFTTGVVASLAVAQIGTFGIAIISCTVTGITAGVNTFVVLSATTYGD